MLRPATPHFRNMKRAILCLRAPSSGLLAEAQAEPDPAMLAHAHAHARSDRDGSDALLHQSSKVWTRLRSLLSSCMPACASRSWADRYRAACRILAAPFYASTRQRSPKHPSLCCACH